MAKIEGCCRLPVSALTLFQTRVNLTSKSVGSHEFIKRLVEGIVLGEAKRKLNTAAQVRLQPIQDVVDKICKDAPDSSHVVHLFLLLRPVFAAIDPILYDLINFLAHPEGRSKGVSFDRIRPYVEKFIIVSKRGGTITSPKPVFNRADIVPRLCKTLKGVGINFDEKILLSKSELIVNFILNEITETELKFDHPEVVKCYLKLIGNEMMLCLHFNLKGPLIKLSPTTTLQLKLFG